MPELEFRAYISSTLKDMEEEREIARKVIAKYAVVLESYSASPEPTAQSCIDDVRQGHVYVGIIGHRYGWVPQENNPEGKSITELEYDACRAPGQRAIPRLIFRRTKSPDKFRDDSDVKPNTADQIRAFRARIIERTVDFEEIDDFRLQLQEAIIAQRQRFHVSQSPQTAAFSPTQGIPGTLKAVVLLHVRGTDELIVNRITSADSSRFIGSHLSPTEANTATRVEDALQLGQLACLVVTEGSLKRMTDPQALPRFDSALATLNARGGLGILLRVNVPAAMLPEGWREYPSVEIDGEALEKSPAATVNGLFSSLAAAALHEPTTQPRKALPVIALAATSQDIAKLTAADAKPFKKLPLANIRRAQFETMVKVARERDEQWPADFYGDRRTDWRCFGPKGRTVAELVDAAVAAINQAPRGSRERNAMQLTEIVVRHYSIDEYLTDRHGSRAAIQSVVARGALVCVDEMALFDPDLRDAARGLLTGSMAAIVSLSPCDPAHLPTRDLLSEESFLLASLVTRFQAEYDPQCELSLNSEYRLLRWLRTAIPRLLTEGDGRTGRPTLIDKAESLLAAGGE